MAIQSSPAERSAAATVSGTADQRIVTPRWSACSISRIRLKMVEIGAVDALEVEQEEAQRHLARQRQPRGDALQNAMGGAEEQVALEPDHLDRLAVLRQQPRCAGGRSTLLAYRARCRTRAPHRSARS